MLRAFIGCLALVLSLLTAAWPSHAVVNPSFEDVQISGVASSNPADVPGWTKIGPIADGLMWRVGYIDGVGSITVAGDGNQFVTLGCGSQVNTTTCGTTSWSQTIPLAAGLYTLGFDLAAEHFSDIQSLTASLSGGATTSQLFTATGAGTENYWRTWQTQSLPFVADGNPVQLTFSTTNLLFDIGIDDVHIDLVPTNGNGHAVPEPATLLLLGSALVGTVAARRHMRQPRR